MFPQWTFKLKFVKFINFTPLFDLQYSYNCLSHWRGETRAETARREKMQSAQARRFFLLNFLLLFYSILTSIERGDSAVENLGSDWQSYMIF